MTTLKPKKDIKGNNIISRNLNQEEDFGGNIIKYILEAIH